MGDSDFRPPEQIELKLGMIDYVELTTPHAKIYHRRFTDIREQG